MHCLYPEKLLQCQNSVCTKLNPMYMVIVYSIKRPPQQPILTHSIYSSTHSFNMQIAELHHIQFPHTWLMLEVEEENVLC